MSLRSRRRIPVPTPGREDQDDAREQDESAHDQDDAHEQYGIEETQDDPAHEPAHELAETQDAQTQDAEAADEQDEPAETQDDPAQKQYYGIEDTHDAEAQNDSAVASKAFAARRHLNSQVFVLQMRADRQPLIAPRNVCLRRSPYQCKWHKNPLRAPEDHIRLARALALQGSPGPCA